MAGWELILGTQVGRKGCTWKAAELPNRSAIGSKLPSTSLLRSLRPNTKTLKTL